MLVIKPQLQHKGGEDVNLFQNGEPDAGDEHNMGPSGPMKNTLLGGEGQWEKPVDSIYFEY